MPVSRERQRAYPGGSLQSPDWRALRALVLDRAGNRCEGSPAFPECRAANGQPHPVTGSKVVLTIAHLDQNPANSDPANLRALCQRCHNRHDARTRAASRKGVSPRIDHASEAQHYLDTLAEAHVRGGALPARSAIEVLLEGRGG